MIYFFPNPDHPQLPPYLVNCLLQCSERVCGEADPFNRALLHLYFLSKHAPLPQHLITDVIGIVFIHVERLKKETQAGCKAMIMNREAEIVQLFNLKAENKPVIT